MALRIYSVAWIALALSSGCTTGCRQSVDAPQRPLAPRDVFTQPEVVALVEAARSGDIELVDELIAEGADANAVGKQGITPLACVVGKNRQGYLRLLEHGADPNRQEADGASVMTMAASEKDDTEWLELAIQHGGNPNLLDTKNKHIPRSTPIFDAIRAQNVDAIHVLIKAGANVNHREGRGRTPLYYAAEFVYFDVVYVLLEAGADFRADDPFGRPIVDRIVDILGYPLPDEDARAWRGKVLAFLKDKGVSVDPSDETGTAEDKITR